MKGKRILNIKPIWEDPKKYDGGSFSFKINNKFVINSWKNLSYVLLGETLTTPELSTNVTGITISPKKNFCIIKIWLSNCDNNNPNIISDIEWLAKNGCLFKKHINNEYDYTPQIWSILMWQSWLEKN